MCNLCSVTTNVEALTQMVRSFNRPNLPELGSVYPNYEAPIFRPTSQGVELTMPRHRRLRAVRREARPTA